MTTDNEEFMPLVLAQRENDDSLEYVPPSVYATAAYRAMIHGYATGKRSPDGWEIVARVADDLSARSLAQLLNERPKVASKRPASDVVAARINDVREMRLKISCVIRGDHDHFLTLKFFREIAIKATEIADLIED